MILKDTKVGTYTIRQINRWRCTWYKLIFTTCLLNEHTHNWQATHIQPLKSQHVSPSYQPGAQPCEDSCMEWRECRMFLTGQTLQIHWDKSLWQKQKVLCLLPAGQSGWCRWGRGALPQRGWCTSSCESCCGRSAAHGRSRRWRCRSGGRPVKAGCQPMWWSLGAGRGLHHCAEGKTKKLISCMMCDF